ncbi:hypothetical protein Tco_0627544 [Tanacetum coccineum]|uniref:Uncharacterized protein n=1 Tax=Tanacetum coccineum TaxID=301880 RepID=A0ABQ4WMP6_9ASTR
MATVSPTPDTTSQDHSKPTSINTKVLPGSIAGMSRHRSKIMKHLKTTFVTNKYFQEKMREIPNLLKNLVPELTVAMTNEINKEVVPRLVNATITRDREIALTNVPQLISQEFTTHAPKIIGELFQSHMQNTVLNLYPTSISSTATTSTADLQHQLYLRMKTNFQDQAADPELIVEVVRITYDQQHGLDYMEQIIVMRENDKTVTFYGADFKYLSKNDIEDISRFSVRNRKLPDQDQLNRTNIDILSGIEAHDPYSIVDKPNTGLIYLNNKKEKRVMYLVEIVKLCDTTLKRVLKEVKLKIFETEFLKKAPLLGGLEIDIMKAYEREITKRLRRREQMRRWEPFVNERSILPTMRRQ